MHLKKIILFFSALWVLGSCAKVMPLTGGDEDKTPPAFRSAKPDTFSTHFKGKTITIKFDEYINLVDPTREIIISPPIDPAPEFQANGQSVKVKFKDSLLPNVTYVINFGESIEDITESNKNVGFTYVFSTGDFIDSGTVTGTILDAFTGKPAEGYKVMLYEKDVNDSFPYKEKPFYLAYTNSSGMFNLQNLKLGEYKIFALLEDNNNFLFDRSGEKIAFLSATVETNDTIPFKMMAFAEEGGAVTFNKAKSVSSVRTDFYFSGKANQVQISPGEGMVDTSYWAYELNTTKDTVTLWHMPPATDTIAFYLKGEGLSDTVSIKANKGPILSTGGKRNKNVPETTFSLDAASNMKYDLYKNPVLSFSEPVKSIDTSRIKLLADSISIPFQLLADSSSPRAFRLVFSHNAKFKYLFTCDSAAFVNISGKVSAKNSFSLGFREAAEYASVKILYEDSIIKFPKIWQLMKDDKVIRTTFAPASQNDVVFNSLEPGSYSLRLILDENDNKQWDTGNFMEKKLPERVLYLTEPIELKPGWDSEITWKVTKPKLKR